MWLQTDFKRFCFRIDFFERKSKEIAINGILYLKKENNHHGIAGSINFPLSCELNIPEFYDLTSYMYKNKNNTAFNYSLKPSSNNR